MKGLLFTFGMTYGGALASFFNPYYGFLVYVCFGVLRPTAMWWYSVPEGNYSRIIAIAFIASWLLHGLGNWQLGRAKAPMIALGAFLAMNVISMLLAPQREIAWSFVETLAKVVIPMAMGVTLINSFVRLNQLVWVVVLSQGFVAYEMNMTYFSGYNRFYYDGFAGLDNNGVALTLVAGAGIAFFLALYETNWLRKAVASLVFLLMTHGVMFSFSRGGLLALIGVGIAAFYVLPKRPLYFAVLIAAALIGYRLAGEEVLERFATVFADKSERDESADSRLALWRACYDEMARNPLVGVGPDHFRLVAHNHGFMANKAAHSTWMQTGAEIGVMGLASLLAFYGLILWRLQSVMKAKTESGKPTELAQVAQMAFSSLVGFGIAAQFVSVNLVEIPFYVAAIGMGTLVLASQPVSASEADLEYYDAYESNLSRVYV